MATHTICVQRLERLSAAIDQRLEFSGLELLECLDPFIAVTSSRLGHDPALHRHVCQFLHRSLLDCRARNASLLVAKGSAIEPWAVRAAELFDVPLVRLSTDSKEPNADLVVSAAGKKLSRDEVLIALAERVDAVYVRRSGTIERCLRDRLKYDCSKSDHCATTRVAISPNQDCAAMGLIAAGAVGWFLPNRDHEDRKSIEAQEDTIGVDICTDNCDDWMHEEGKWLAHCTRGRDGPWPDETENQYRDAVLLGDVSAIQRGPFESLQKILRCGRLIPSAITTAKSTPVVCFSAVPLAELLSRRCFRPHLGRWDYESYGVAIRSSLADRLGIKNVIYGDPENRKLLPQEQQFRFHPAGTTYDWTSEREWRTRQIVELNDLPIGDVRVFAKDTARSRQSLQDCQWQVSWIP